MGGPPDRRMAVVMDAASRSWSKAGRFSSVAASTSMNVKPPFTDFRYTNWLLPGPTQLGASAASTTSPSVRARSPSERAYSAAVPCARASDGDTTKLDDSSVTRTSRLDLIARSSRSAVVLVRQILYARCGRRDTGFTAQRNPIELDTPPLDRPRTQVRSARAPYGRS